MRIDRDINRRITIAKLLLIFGIVITHVPPFMELSDLTFHFAETTKAFFAHAFFRAAVPLLAAISGYLLFSSTLYQNIKKLFVKKFRSIVIPLILWNLPMAMIIYVLQKYNHGTYDAMQILYPFTLDAWLNAVTGISTLPINKPLYFLRDIFVISIIAPLYWAVFKKIPYIGLVVLLIVFYLDLDGELVMRNSMYFTFYLGILAATQNWNLKCLDKYGYHLFTVFTCACIYIIYNRINNKEAFIIFSSFMIWPALSKIVDTPIGNFFEKYSQYSFLLFLSHVPIMFILHKLYLHYAVGIPYFVFWVLAPAITIYICLAILPNTRNIFPGLYRVAVGGR